MAPHNLRAAEGAGLPLPSEDQFCYDSIDELKRILEDCRDLAHAAETPESRQVFDTAAQFIDGSIQSLHAYLHRVHPDQPVTLDEKTEEVIVSHTDADDWRPGDVGPEQTF